MWILYWVLLFVLLGVAFREIIIYRVNRAVDEMMGVAPENQVPKLEQIRNLKELGITFCTEEAERGFIFNYEANAYYAAHPYYALLTDAGADELLDNVYGVQDRECIYDSEYGKILAELGRISGLLFTDISCPDRHQVVYRFHGRRYRWKGKNNRDWADHRLAASLNRFCKDGKRFFTDNFHEGIIYFFGTKDQAAQLNTRFGLRFR